MLIALIIATRTLRFKINDSYNNKIDDNFKEIL